MKKETLKESNSRSVFDLHGKERRDFFLAILIPFIGLGLQWVFWQYISPFVWFLFFPAVFISAKLGRLKGGLVSTVLSALMVVYFFMPPQLSWEVKNPYNLFSVAMFVIMGYLFSDVQERFWAANKRTENALRETQTANETITKLYEKTRELDELKTQFFANVSHELRTPLTLILGPVQKALHSPDLDPELRHDLDVVRRNARFLHRHVNDLLDVSKLDAGQMALHYSQIDLVQSVRMLASQFNVVADERNIQYQVEAEGSFTAQVDAEKYQRILLNLLSNAFKFTPDGGRIKLAFAVEGEAAITQVSDSGPGIPVAQRAMVFERFHQLEGNASRKHGGTGLGLAIVKEFVELHHGDITIGDSPDNGAMVTVRIPLSAPAGTSVDLSSNNMENETSLELVDELFMEHVNIQDPATRENLNAPSILVVEDSPDMNEFISSALKKQYRIFTAANGQIGLEKALALKPNLILTDVMMPIMSGDQMVAAIRKHSELKDVPIVMLTAKADEKLRVEMLQAGVEDYINKPFTVEELLARISNLLMARQRGADALLESEERYRDLFQKATLGIFQSTPEGKVVLVNPAFTKMFGYASPEEVREKVKNVSTDIFADPQRRLEIIRLRIENPELNTFENLYQRKDGSTFIGRLHIHTIKYVTGNEIFEGFIEDISEYKRAEEALKTALNFSNDLINSMQDGVSVLDKNGVHLDVNTALCRMTGFSREEIIGTEIPHPYWPEEEYEHIQSAFQQTLANAATTFELIFKRKNGARFPVIVSPFAIKDELGNVVSYSATVKDISERKQAEIRLRRFWDLPLVGMAISSPARRFIEVNLKLADMFGYTTQELVGMTWVELTHPEDVDRNIQLLEEVIAGKSDQYELDKRFIRRDGTLLYTHIAAHCVRDTNGAVDYMVLLIQDVTETKQADQKLQKIKNLLSETEIIGHVGGWELNIDTKEQTWTEEIYRIHELDLTYQPTVEEGINFYMPSSRPIIEKAVQRAIENGDSFNEELEIITAKGNQRWVHAIGKADLDQRRVYGFFQDITERKQTDEKLRMSEANFRNLAENITDGILIGTAAGRHIYANSQAALLLGYTQDEILQTSQKDLADPSVYPQLKQRLEDRIAGLDVPTRYETIIRRKDGSSFHAEVAGTYTIWQGQACDLVFIRDITERKQAEEALQEFAYFPALNPGPSLRIDGSGFIRQANPAALSLGLETDIDISSVIPEIAADDLIDCIRSGSTNTYEVKLRESVFLLTMRGVPNMGQAYVYGSDITERKQAEIILQARMKISQFADSHTLDELLRMTLDEAEALTGSTIGFGHFLEADQKTLKLQMWSTNTLNNMCTAEGKGSHYSIDQAGVWVDAVHAHAAVIHNDYPNLAHRKGLPEGHAPVLRELVVPIMRNEQIVMIVGVGNKPTAYTDQDISTVTQLANFSWDVVQRKRVEVIVRENEERYRTVVSNAPGIIFVTDEKGVFTLSEGKGLVNLGLRPSQVVGQSVLDVYKDYPDIINAVKDTLGGKSQRHETKIQGLVFDVLYSPILDQKGRVEKILGVATDITERKRMEIALQESEARLSFITANIPDHILMQDKDLKYTFILNPQLGKTEQEVIGKTDYELLSHEDADRLTKAKREVIESGHPKEFDISLTSRSGKTEFFEGTFVPKYDNAGRNDGLIGYFKNVTERKLAEAALRAASAYNRRLIEASLDPLVTIGPDGKIQDANEATELITGVLREQLIGDEFSNYFTDPEKARKGYQTVLAEGFLKDYPLTIQHISGKTTDVLYNASVYKDEYGETQGVFAAAHDITERKRAEEALRASELFNKSILNSLTAHIAVLDENGVIIAVNEAWKKFAQENNSPDPDAYLGDNYLAACEVAIQNGDQTANQVDLGIRAVLNGMRSQFKAEYACNSPDQQRWFTITVVPLYQHGQGVIAIHQDITESKLAQQSLEASQLILKNALELEKQLARTDPLTGVNNRRYLYELAEREFEISQRYQQPLSVLMYDIDHFKKFNDTFGHMLGDQILKIVTDTAVKELRSADTIGRYGGEEFIILLPMTNAEQAYSLAERIRTAVAANTVPTQKGDTFVTLSIGIVEKSYNVPAESVEEIFHRADEAMYAAKQGGRNRTEIGD